MKTVIKEFKDFMGFMGIPLLSICVIIMLVLILGTAILDVFNGVDPAFGSEFDKRNAFIEQCLASEGYTREECIQLARPKVSK